ncbi:MAG: M14 family metallopeptidase [Myxococcota bacterium]
MLQTRAEATSFRETSLHADVMAVLQALDQRGDPRFHLSAFGTSPQGRELPLVVLSTRGVRTPAQARAAGLPVVLMLDGIHPGEVEGKEATLALLRDVLEGREGDWLDQLTLVVVPLFNPDGGDALDPANRKLDIAHLSGQPGPLVGTRTQSHGINLNRDYLRHEAPEMRLLQQRVCIPWAADLTVDNHATNGSVHRMSMTVDVPHTVHSGPPGPIALSRDRLVPDVIAAVARRGIPSGWYGNFVEDERALDAGSAADPRARVGEGWMTYPHHPRFGSNYRGLTGRMDLLLECYSYLSFEERVRTASAWQIETLAWVAAHGDDVRETVAAARVPDRVAVGVPARGHRHARHHPHPRAEDAGGAPTEVTLPHLARFVGTEVVDRPRAYAVPPAVAEHLRGHGLQVRDAAGERVDAQVGRVEALDTTAGRAILEAGGTGRARVSWREEARAVPEGWAIVETDQPLGAVAVYLCEPHSDDGLVENRIVPPVAVGDDHPAWRVG